MPRGTRLTELGDPGVDHTCVWRLNPRLELVLDAEELTDSFRFCLGCAGPWHPLSVLPCNSGFRGGARLLRSGHGQSRSVRDGHFSSTPLQRRATTLPTEVPSLIPGTDLRVCSGKFEHGAGRPPSGADLDYTHGEALKIAPSILAPPD